MYWPNLKSVAFPVPDIIQGILKFVQSLDTLTRTFLQNFHWLLFGWTLLLFWLNVKFVTFPVPELIAIGPKGHPPTPKVTWGNFGETRGGVGKSGVLEHKSGDISESVQIEEKLLWGPIGTYALSNGTIPDPLRPPLPQDRGSHTTQNSNRYYLRNG